MCAHACSMAVSVVFIGMCLSRLMLKLPAGILHSMRTTSTVRIDRDVLPVVSQAICTSPNVTFCRRLKTIRPYIIAYKEALARLAEIMMNTGDVINFAGRAEIDGSADSCHHEVGHLKCPQARSIPNERVST